MKPSQKVHVSLVAVGCLLSGPPSAVSISSSVSWVKTHFSSCQMLWSCPPPSPNTVNCQSIVCQPQAFSRAFCFSIQSVITLESVLNCLLNWTAIILPRIPSDEPHTSSKFTAAPVSSSWWTSVSSNESSSFCFCFFGLEFSVVFEVGNILQL